jgi:hypothetical protein
VTPIRLHSDYLLDFARATAVTSLWVLVGFLLARISRQWLSVLTMNANWSKQLLRPIIVPNSKLLTGMGFKKM